jgi:hypothetical protein
MSSITLNKCPLSGGRYSPSMGEMTLLLSYIFKNEETHLML